MTTDRTAGGAAGRSSPPRPRVTFDLEDPVLVRAAWSRLIEPNDDPAYRALAVHGPEHLLREVLSGGGEPRWRVRVPDLDPARDLATVRRFGGRVVIPGDPEWPAQVDRLTRPPVCLWVRGPLPLEPTCRRSVALVGARAMTGYGERVALDLAAELTRRGFLVVSGAAYGIDAVAHRGALTSGPTLAVLACGVDRWYPPGNAALLDRIITDGAVVSEIPPGSSPTRWRFLERNRLIAALTLGTVVVEAAWRSGALGTAARAAELGRPFGAVPGPVTAATSAGCHRLLRDGGVCVTDADEVVELVGRIGDDLAPERTSPARPGDDLASVPRRVLEALPVRAAATPDGVARAAGLDVRAVRRALAVLAVEGLAERHGTGWRRSAPTRGRT
jgi:DNA processing protein